MPGKIKKKIRTTTLGSNWWACMKGGDRNAEII
jgi:hypothetical protein